MSPRPYSMARRAATADATRDRILEATLDLYRKQGIAATTMAQVAERADVARATVLNHFGGTNGLTTAAIEAIADSLSLPTIAIFDGASSRAERLRRLTVALYELYERSTPWFAVLQADLRSVAAMRRRDRRFWTDMRKLFAEALGPLRSRRRVMATVAGLTSPATYGALKEAGLTSAEAAAVVGDLLAYSASD